MTRREELYEEFKRYFMQEVSSMISKLPRPDDIVDAERVALLYATADERADTHRLAGLVNSDQLAATVADFRDKVTISHPAAVDNVNVVFGLRARAKSGVFLWPRKMSKMVDGHDKEFAAEFQTKLQQVAQFNLEKELFKRMMTTLLNVKSCTPAAMCYLMPHMERVVIKASGYGAPAIDKKRRWPPELPALDGMERLVIRHLNNWLNGHFLLGTFENDPIHGSATAAGEAQISADSQEVTLRTDDFGRVDIRL